MLKYLIIQLDKSSVSFCHYPNERMTHQLIPLNTLKEAIFWSMKENLTLQFLYPDYELPQEYKNMIAETFHADIVSSTCEDASLRENADVVVFDSLGAINYYPLSQSQAYVVRIALDDLLKQGAMLGAILPNLNRLSIAITDVEAFTKDKESEYKLFLENLSNRILEEYKKGHGVQVNLLTDRILLDEMNNCNAGYESITIAPDGKFYICPAFFLGEGSSVGDIESGLEIKNPQLYRLDYAPICRLCDAYQCRRCIWLNRNMTLEVNTPSHEQCVMAHLERNASKKLLQSIRTIGEFLPGKEIKEIDYLDPFEIINKN